MHKMVEHDHNQNNIHWKRKNQLMIEKGEGDDNENNDTSSSFSLNKRFKTTHVGDVGPTIVNRENNNVNDMKDVNISSVTCHHFSQLSSEIIVNIFNFCDSVHFISCTLSSVCQQWYNIVHSYIFPTSEWLWCQIAHRTKFYVPFEYLVARSEQLSQLDQPFRDSNRWFTTVKQMFTDATQHYLNSCFHSFVHQFELERDLSAKLVEVMEVEIENEGVMINEKERNTNFVTSDFSIPFRLVKVKNLPTKRSSGLFCNHNMPSVTSVISQLTDDIINKYRELLQPHLQSAIVAQVNFEEMKKGWIGHLSHSLQTDSFCVPVTENENVRLLKYTKGDDNEGASSSVDELTGVLYILAPHGCDTNLDDKCDLRLLHVRNHRCFKQMANDEESEKDDSEEDIKSYEIQFPPIHSRSTIEKVLNEHKLGKQQQELDLMCALIDPRWDPQYEHLNGFRDKNKELNELFPLRIVHCDCAMFAKTSTSQSSSSIRLFSIPSHCFSQDNLSVHRLLNQCSISIECLIQEMMNGNKAIQILNLTSSP